MSRQHLSWWHLSISGISPLLLTRFWWNFKGSFLGTTRTDSNYQVNICLGKIWPCDICPYLEYLSCYRLNCDQKNFLLLISRTRLFYQKLLYPKFVYGSQFLGGRNYVKIQFLVAEILRKNPVSFPFRYHVYLSTKISLKGHFVFKTNMRITNYRIIKNVNKWKSKQVNK